MALVSAVIVPLLLMPPEKVRPSNARRPTPPDEMVPVLTMPPREGGIGQNRHGSGGAVRGDGSGIADPSRKRTIAINDDPSGGRRDGARVTDVASEHAYKRTLSPKAPERVPELVMSPLNNGAFETAMAPTAAEIEPVLMIVPLIVLLPLTRIPLGLPGAMGPLLTTLPVSVALLMLIQSIMPPAELV